MSEQKSSFLDADDLRPIIKFVGRNWHIMLIFSAVAFVVAFLINYRSPNIYAAKTEILLKSSETYDYQSNMLTSLGYVSLMQDITNQKRILSSYDLTNKVLDKVNFNQSYYLVGRLKVLQVDHFDAITVNCDWRRMDPKLYNLPLNIYVIDLKTYEFSYEINNKKQTFILEFGNNHEDLDFTIQVDLSPQVDETWLKTVMDQNFQIVVHPTNWLISKYSRSLNIENTEYTSILTLTLQDELSSRAKMFLDTLASEYIMFTLENQITINKNTEKFIDKQLEEVTRILDSLEFSINQYKQSQDIFDLPREQAQAFDQLGKFDFDLKTLEMREQTMKEI
jgi:uncharacterized protein involved in exopolysaccharide biosynthesis